MMSENSSQSKLLTIFIIIFPLISLLLYGGISYLFFDNTQQKIILNDIDRYERTLLEVEQNGLKEKINNLSQFIRYYDGRNGEKIKDDVKNIVNVATDIANNIFHANKGVVDDETLKKMIKNALKEIKFEGSIGYLFVLDLKGNVHVHIDDKLVTKNILNIQDVNGKYILREFNKVIAKDGEGFVDYYWYINGKNKRNMHYKISFVKKLDAYDWYLGAGEYLKYMKKFIREDILEYVKANSEYKNGFFFITDSRNEIVFKPPSINAETINDLKKYRIEGLYKDQSHIAYTRYIAQYDWYITSVKNLADTRKTISLKKKENIQNQNEITKTNLFVMLFTWVVSILLSLYLSFIINRMLKSYQRELFNANEQLVFQSRQALIGELFPMIAHQWRQPINKIASTLALLRFEIDNKKIKYEDINIRCNDIEEDIEFMSETIDDFRTFYEPKEAQEKVNLVALINKSLEFLDNTIRTKNIKIVKKLENIEYVLHGNEFLQVMINLIKNAIDSISSNGIIEVELFIREEQICITVADNGLGMSSDTRKRIFDPYFTTKKDSMGLGLYMTKMIIEKHMNGRITVINRESTGGVVFNITFSI